MSDETKQKRYKVIMVGWCEVEECESTYHIRADNEFDAKFAAYDLADLAGVTPIAITNIELEGSANRER
jgi:hypothetical protein